jgi:hypothetical protein
VLASFGEFFFGASSRATIEPIADAHQDQAIAGVDGVATLWGGARGGRVTVDVLWVRPSVAELNALEAGLASLADGVSRRLVDGRGRVWSECVLEAEPVAGPVQPAAGGGWALRLRAVFRVLRG